MSPSCSENAAKSKDKLVPRGNLQPGESEKHREPLKGRSRSEIPTGREIRGVLTSAVGISSAFDKTSRSAPRINGRQETGDSISGEEALTQPRSRAEAGLYLSNAEGHFRKRGILNYSWDKRLVSSVF